jgi:hypothetical protein
MAGVTAEGVRARHLILFSVSRINNWVWRAVATPSVHGAYRFGVVFDPHRPYQSFLFSISYIVKDPSIGTSALTKVKFRVSEAL